MTHDGFMCNGCGDIIPVTHACAVRHEVDDPEQPYSFYHLNCMVSDICEDCGMHRKVCDACCEVSEE